MEVSDQRNALSAVCEKRIQSQEAVWAAASTVDLSFQTGTYFPVFL
jgi:hypothetical protein